MACRSSLIALRRQESTTGFAAQSPTRIGRTLPGFFEQHCIAKPVCIVLLNGHWRAELDDSGDPIGLISSREQRPFSGRSVCFAQFFHSSAGADSSCDPPFWLQQGKSPSALDETRKDRFRLRNIASARRQKPLQHTLFAISGCWFAHNPLF